MTEKHGYNSSLSLLKILCTLLIIVHHTEYFYGVLNRGYIAVEFFFVVSGYLMIRKHELQSDLTTLQYTKARIRRLFPEYLFALAAVVIVRALILCDSPYKHWYSPMVEMVMLQNVGIPLPHESANYPCWYLSVLFYGSILIFWALRSLPRKIYNATAIIIAAGTYFFLIIHGNTVEQWETVGHVFYLPFWRGMADMCIGTLLFQLPPLPKHAATILQILCFAVILLFLRLPGDYDYYTTALIIIFIWASTSSESKFWNPAGLQSLDRYQYGLYLNHISVVLLFRHYQIASSIGAWLSIPLIIIATLVLSIIGQKVSMLIMRRAHAS